MPKKDGPKKFAYVEDADDAGNAIPDTETYAASEPRSPTKQQPNTSRTRREMRRADSASSAGATYTDSDSTAQTSVRSKTRTKEKEKDKNKDKPTKRVTINDRPPPPRHYKTTPATAPRRADEPAYYGVSGAVPIMTPGISRPRAQSSAPRPSSYYGTTSRPPLANTRWHDIQYSQPLATAPNPFPPTSYPPHSTYLPRESPFAPRPQFYAQGANDYFGAQPRLASRFNRPASAMGQRAVTSATYGDPEIIDSRPLLRRTSLRAATRDEEDRRRMPPPPPPRPSTTRPSSRPPPPRSGYDDDAFRGTGSLYSDISPLSQVQYEYATPAVSRPRRQSGNFSAAQYDAGPYRPDVVTAGGSRRNSYYGQSLSSGSGLEDKMRQASRYQEDVGGPSAPLTSDALRKARRSGGSGSRSTTRSSTSKDESDYKHSATTRTTLLSNNDEDVTIRVKGNTVLKVGGAELQCEDGAEINVIKRSGGTSRGGSDRSSYIDADERQSRMDRTSTRTRATSQAGSYTRTMPSVPQQYDSYAYRPGPPAYPAYPGTYSARPEGGFI